MRKSTSKQERALYIEEYYKSGLSKTKFCREKGLRLETFYNWFSSAKLKEKSKLAFVPLSIKNPEQEKIPFKEPVAEKIFLKTLSGISLEFPTSISASWLSFLLKEL